MGVAGMISVYATSTSIVSPLGIGTAENMSALAANTSALKPVYIKTDDFTSYASCYSTEQLAEIDRLAAANLLSVFEKSAWLSAKLALAEKSVDVASGKTIFVFATTKGNIELLGKPGISKNELELYHSAQKICNLFGNPNKPLIISNACISGLSAVITASRLIRGGFYNNAVIIAADTVNNFVLSGFQSLKALSSGPCKPFDLNRSGVNLGEAAATLVLSKSNAGSIFTSPVQIMGGAVTNDANHISGPSRTGNELALAINNALSESGLLAHQMGFISAHGTATLYNDEMESKALAICGLQNTPAFSLKAYYGHTLGAAGLLEAIVAMHCLEKGLALKSLGYEDCGTPHKLNICTTNTKAAFSTALKTTAGFGGCNAAMVITKK